MTRPTDEEFLARVNALIEPLGCTATGIGPDSVGVQGDARVVGPVVFVTFPDTMDMAQVGEITTRIINEVRGLTRVLMNVRPV